LLLVIFGGLGMARFRFSLAILHTLQAN